MEKVVRSWWDRLLGTTRTLFWIAATALSEGRWTHDFPITVEAARQLGLPVSANMPPLIYDLMDLYPRAGEGRPSVMYVPLRRAAPARDARQDAPSTPAK